MMKVLLFWPFLWACAVVLLLAPQPANGQNLVIGSTNNLATLAGIGLLGTAAALGTGYALGRTRGGRRYRGRYRGYYRYRGRRSPQDSLPPLQDILEETAKLDSQGCIPALLCAAASIHPSNRTPAVTLLLQPFSSEGPANETAFDAFSSAVERGSSGQDCSSYSSCEVTPHALLDLYHEVIYTLLTKENDLKA